MIFLSSVIFYEIKSLLSIPADDLASEALYEQQLIIFSEFFFFHPLMASLWCFVMPLSSELSASRYKAKFKIGWYPL